MKRLTLLLLVSVFIFSNCKKSKEEEKPKSIVTVVNGGKSYELETGEQYLKLSGDSAEIRVFAFGPEMAVEVHALSLSPNHQEGVGEYFLMCCNNDFWEKFGPTVGYEGHRPDNPYRQIGYLRITKKEGNMIEGSFSISGQNSDVVTKEITATFKIYL